MINPAKVFWQDFFILKKLELLGCFGALAFRESTKKLHHPKLLVRQGENDDLTLGGQESFHAFNMYFGVFAAAAMAHINGILHHGKAILLQVFPELRVVFPVGFGFGWQIKKNEYPQNLILVKPVKTIR